MATKIKAIIKVLLHVLYVFRIKKDKIFLIAMDGTKIGFDQKVMADYIFDNNLKYKVYWCIDNRKANKSTPPHDFTVI